MKLISAELLTLGEEKLVRIKYKKTFGGVITRDVFLAMKVGTSVWYKFTDNLELVSGDLEKFINFFLNSGVSYHLINDDAIKNK